jgi:hypothetical protein
MNGGSFLQAIRGPVMLIALGSLVAIDYAGIYGFWRTWPILIILFGILKLAERAVAKPPDPYQGGPSDMRPPGGNAI